MKQKRSARLRSRSLWFRRFIADINFAPLYPDRSRFHGTAVINGSPEHIGEDRNCLVLRNYADTDGCCRSLLVSQNQISKRDIQGTSGSREISRVFNQRFEQIGCRDVIGGGFEIQFAGASPVSSFGS